MTLLGSGPSQMGGGEHEGEKVWQVVAVEAFPELFPAQLCATLLVKGGRDRDDTR